MDTNRIKKFAIEARNTLKAGIAGKLTKLGFKKDGTVADNMRPVLLQGGCVWNGATETEGFYHRWMSLYERVQRKGLNEVYEEAAYTWFNRLVAIRILQKNGLAAPILDFVDIARTPRIVDDARSGQFPQMSAEDRDHLNDLLDDDSKTTEQFALLITAWCQNNPIINSCFGGIKDYTEILLPHDILKENGFVDMINHTEFITDEDFKSPELIGWLYQFYISERKSEVYSKEGKFEADEIPAATQIFTPNWIVKYMVQNTVGRIYLDNHPYSTALKSNWKYLVEGEPTPQESIYRYNELTDLKVADLACGSGHILNECFDLLYELYMEEAYSRKEAIENIFKYNLTGVDLDKRAQQLSKFALLLKACQKDRSFADAHCMPHVLTMPKLWNELTNENVETFLDQFFKGSESKEMVEELTSVYNLIKDADSLGSIMKFNLSDSTRNALAEAVTCWKKEQVIPKEIENQLPSLELVLALTEKYSALIMNPPYMGRGNMNATLSRYSETYYPSTKNDIYAIFIEIAISKCNRFGKSGLITMESWMFLKSYEQMRSEIINNIKIDSLIHLPYIGKGWTPLGIAFGTSAFTISKYPPRSQSFGDYQYIRYYETTPIDGAPPITFPTINERKSQINQLAFLKLPGNIIGYWLSQNFVDSFTKSPLGDYLTTREGMATADNDRFLRYWPEVSIQNFSKKNSSSDKWYPYNKGGAFRRWFGNRDFIVDWSQDGYNIKNNIDPRTGRVRSHNYNGEFAFKECLTWSALSSGKISLRYCEEGFLWDSKGACGFSETDLLYSLGLLNSIVARRYLEFLSATKDFKVGDIIKIPVSIVYKELIERIVQNNISISKSDWDAHETSWDFQENELVNLQKQGLGTVTACLGNTTVMKCSTLSLLYAEYVAKWEKMFRDLHANEEELNRQFIEIYGLQDELTPDVPLDEVSILQQGEIKIENNQIHFQRDVVIKQLISYAVGCWMGRYRLDKPGLHIAHPSPTADEICTYSFGKETLTIDDDGNIPLLPYDCPFDDNLQNRIADFVRIAFGADSLTENLNFIEESLGCSIEKYLDKDFWKDHKKMYQNKPIYWLWSSKKGAFRVLSYMHRMDAYTAERIRSKYLLPYIEYVQNKIHNLENKITSLTTTEKRSLDNYRKILEECREYHDRLHVVAEQAIAFDLDDGVTVNYAKFGDVLSKIK